jgi:hypothetical protein
LGQQEVAALVMASSTQQFFSHMVLQEWTKFTSQIGSEQEGCIVIVGGKALTLGDIVAIARFEPPTLTS